jgi:hypothetical protein
MRAKVLHFKANSAPDGTDSRPILLPSASIYGHLVPDFHLLSGLLWSAEALLRPVCALYSREKWLPEATEVTL